MIGEEGMVSRDRASAAAFASAASIASDSSHSNI